MWFWRVTLRRGSRGPAVADLRRRLFRLGYLSSDGGSEFDEACRNAVTAFQVRRDLQPDGIVGATTWSSLYGQRPLPAQRPPAARSVWAPAADSDLSSPLSYGAPKVEICLSQRTLTLRDGDSHTRTLPVAVGRHLSPTPTGHFTVSAMLHQPGGALGVRWLRLQPGTCGIHGTDEPWTIGTDVTPGCIRLYNRDAEIVFHRVRIGTPVTIAL